jgi:acetoacetyl-CoA reductase
VAKKGEAARIVKEVLDKWQRLDILVNNAGITRDRSMRKMTDDDWAAVINTNLNGTFYCTSAAVPAMVNQRFGRIINISSVVGTDGRVRSGQLFGQQGWHHCLHQNPRAGDGQVQHHGQCDCSGIHGSTEMVDAIPEEIAAQIKAKIPLGRFRDTRRDCQGSRFPCR